MIDEQVLLHAGCSRAIVAHSLAVSRLAVSLAEQVTIPVDGDLVLQGGIIHDIGRAMTNGVDHAIQGAHIARKLGFSERLVNIIERHIGAGITASEAERLGLPKKDYIPQTPEEKLVSYADNLVRGEAETDFAAALERFRNLLGPDHEGIDMFIRQHKEIRSWMRYAQ